MSRFQPSSKQVAGSKPGSVAVLRRMVKSRSGSGSSAAATRAAVMLARALLDADDTTIAAVEDLREAYAEAKRAGRQSDLDVYRQTVAHLLLRKRPTSPTRPL